MQVFERARDRGPRGFAHGLSAFLQLPKRPGHGDGRRFTGFVDEPGDLLAVIHHRLGKDEALRLDRFHRLVGDAADLAGKGLAFARQRRQQAVRFFVEDARHLADVARNGGGKLFRPAGNIAGNVGAYAGQRALGLRRAPADRFGGLT